MALPESLLAKLQAAKAQRRLTAFHKWDDDPTIFLVGFVEEISAESIRFLQVGPCGSPDEEREVSIEEIVWLDFDTDYLRGLEILHPRYVEIIGPKPSAGLKVTNTKSIRQALIKAAVERSSVDIQIGREKRSALIHEVDGDFFSFTELEDGGRPNGVCWLRINVVKELKMGTNRQIADRYLYEHRMAHLDS